MFKYFYMYKNQTYPFLFYLFFVHCSTSLNIQFVSNHCNFVSNETFISDLNICALPQKWCAVLWWSCLYICMSICMSTQSVCLLTHLKNHTSNFTKFSAHVMCGRGLVLHWLQCNMLCTSSFVNYQLTCHPNSCRSNLLLLALWRH